MAYWGLLLQVYRAPGVKTAGGVSSTCDTLTLVGTKRTGKPVEALPARYLSVEATPESPAVVLVESERPDRHPPRLIPLEYMRPHTDEYVIPEGMIGPTDGCAFAGAFDKDGWTDGRWSNLGVEVGFPLALWLVPVFDRVESVESFQNRKSEFFQKVEESKRLIKEWEAKQQQA